MSRPSPEIHPGFATPESLSNWLKPRLPSDSFDSWGIEPGTKNVHNLWLEISEGETLLANSVPPVRTVNVVKLRVIRANGQVLVESRQELSDGSVRHWCLLLSEKMKPSETPEMAVIRAVREELGSVIRVEVGNIGDVVRIVPGSYKMKVDRRIQFLIRDCGRVTYSTHSRWRSRDCRRTQSSARRRKRSMKAAVMQALRTGQFL